MRRRGFIAVLAAIMLVLFLVVLSFSLDLGYISHVRTELQRGADAGALAGAAVLGDGQQDAEEVARRFVLLNDRATDSYDKVMEIEFGEWDSQSRRFLLLPTGGNALRVTVQRRNIPLFFASVIGTRSFDSQASAVAIGQSPLEVMLLLDVSDTMNDDSELKSVGQLGRSAIEANLLEIYRELGAPQLGRLTWTPQYLTVTGKPSGGSSQPQISTTFQGNSVFVRSSKDLSNVVLGFETGAPQKFEGLSGYTGTFAGTGRNAGRPITKVWVKSGSNHSGGGPGYGELFQDNAITIKKTFELDKVRYPYADGSWDDYIDYVKTSPVVRNAGYQNKYGALTWANYLLERKPSAGQTADLWQTSSQPMGAAKTLAAWYLSELNAKNGSGRVGLTVFNSSADTGVVESPLTKDYDSVQGIVATRQAAHYRSPANLGEGMRIAREELMSKGSAGASKMIVLISDGRTSQPDSEAARQHALEQARRARASGISMVVLGVGTNADTDLLRQIAEITGGTYIHPTDTSAAMRQGALDALDVKTEQPSARLVF